MQAANCLLISLNPFGCEIHESCFPHDTNDSDKTIHNLQFTSAWTTFSPFLLFTQ